MILGRMRPLCSSFVPQGMVACAGQDIDAATYPDLVALLGSTTVPKVPPLAPGVRWAMDAAGTWPSGGAPDDDPPLISELVTMTARDVSTFPAGELALADGTVLPIDQTTGALFVAVGAAFGGDGEQTFALPTVPFAAGPPLAWYVVVQGGWPEQGDPWPEM